MGKPFDIKAVEAEAQAEIEKERSDSAKKKIKGKLAEIAAAEQVVTNLRREYDALLLEISDS